MFYGKSRDMFSLLRFAAFGSLVGWGVLHMWDIPYRVILWNQPLLEPLIHGVFGFSWSSYVESPRVDFGINLFTRVLGGILIYSGCVALFSGRLQEKRSRALLIGAGIVTAVGFITYVEKAFQLAMFMEFAAQVAAPLLLYFYLHRKMEIEELSLWLKIAVAFTFVGHGLYALGIFPVPGNFIDMIIGTLGVNEAQARSILLFAGTVDMIIGVGIFIPSIQTPLLAYAVVWGCLTTLARPLSHLDAMMSFDGFVYWSAQALYRLPHAMLPLAVLVAEKVYVRQRTLMREKLGAASA
ncbi:MAG: hypothetical protein ABL958_11245 [Bdellovibrionia bacterium]